MCEINNTERLILEIEVRPGLYNTALPEYSDRNLKTKLWEEVCKHVVPNWKDLESKEKSEKGKEVQKRWKSLRDCMRRELALQKTPFGGAAKKRRKYMYFDQLQFLRTTMEDRQTTSSLCSVTAESNAAPITDTEPVEVPPIPPVQPTETPKSMKKRPTNNNFEQDILKLLEKRSTNPMDDLDDDKQFLLSLLPLMKKFDDDNKITIRVELMNTIRRVLNDIKAQKNCQNALQSLEPSQGNSQWQPPNIPWQPTINNQWQPQPGPSWQSSQTSYLHQVTPIPSPSLSVASSEIIDLGESLM